MSIMIRNIRDSGSNYDVAEFVQMKALGGLTFMNQHPDDIVMVLCYWDPRAGAKIVASIFETDDPDMMTEIHHTFPTLLQADKFFNRERFKYLELTLVDVNSKF